MEPNSIRTKTEIAPLNLIWVKEELLKAGMKDLPQWKEVKEQLLSVLLITHMEREDPLQEFHQILLFTSRSNC